MNEGSQKHTYSKPFSTQHDFCFFTVGHHTKTTHTKKENVKVNNSWCDGKTYLFGEKLLN